MEAALEHLTQTDEDYALEKTELERATIRCKRVRARAFLMADGPNADARKAKAEVAPEVEQADDDYCKTMLAFEKLKASRERAEIVIRAFQTVEATRRAKL